MGERNDRTIVYPNPIFWMCGVSLFEQDKFEEASRIFEKLPGTSKSNYNIGVCFLHTGNFKGAIEAFKKAIELDTLLSIGYFQLAYSYYLLQDFNAAVKNFEATLMFLGATEEIRLHEFGLKCVMLRSEVLFNLALSLRSTGDQAAAARAIGQARCCVSSPNLEPLLGKLESGWVQDIMPFQANLRAIFRDPNNTKEGRPPRSRNVPRRDIQEMPNSSPTINPLGRPHRPAPPPPGVRIGDKSRTRSEAPQFSERVEIKPRSGSEITMPSKTSFEMRRSKEDLKRLSKESKEEAKRLSKEEKKRAKDEKKRLSNSKEHVRDLLHMRTIGGSSSSPNLLLHPGHAIVRTMSHDDRSRSNTVPNIIGIPSHNSMVVSSFPSDYSPRQPSPRQPSPRLPGSSEPSPRNTVSQDSWDINFQEIHLSHEIGRGAFGRVYQGTWRNAPCCVKIANPETSKEAMSEFLKEANSMKKLRSHPNVCQLFGVCTVPTVSIVMELLPEGSLFNMIHNPRAEIDFSTALSMLKDICNGMIHLHAEGVLHLDLATRNLLMKSEAGPNGTKFSVKISDFGMSSSLNNTESLYDVSARNKFPIRWCAPEIASHRQVSKASDVWSYGVVAWEILERKFPYADMSNQEVIEAVFHQGYRLHKPTRITYPGELYQLMLACWQLDPNRRPSFARIYEDLQLIEKKAEFMKKASLLDPEAAASSHGDYGPIWSRNGSGSSGSSLSMASMAPSLPVAPAPALPHMLPTGTYSSMGNFAGQVHPIVQISPNLPPYTVTSAYAEMMPPKSPQARAVGYSDQLAPPTHPPPPPPISSPPITARPYQPVAAPPSPPAVRRFCSGCGKGIKPADCFCSYCGHKLT